MSYEKLGFVSGQKLKAEHLNHMEEGIFNAMNKPAAGGGIIDVIELPTENINEGAFYRLATSDFAADGQTATEMDMPWKCHYVNSLPETGEICTDIDMSYTTMYYSVADNDAYGYVDDELGMGLGVPAGWYPVGTLCEVAQIDWGGIITDIADCPENGILCILLSHDLYIYQDGWCKVPFAYEKAPKVDIQWDGDIGDRFALDMSSLGYANTYLVKVSDTVFSEEEIVGMTYTNSNGYEWTITDDDIDHNMFPGALTIDSGGVGIVYDADSLNAAIGAPAGYMTNGTYFICLVDEFYTNHLFSAPIIKKIDSKYLDIGDVQVDLSEYATKDYVNNLIAGAIGGSY